MYILSHVQRVETGRQVWEGLLSLFLVVAIATASRQCRHETGQWDIRHVHIHKMRYLSNLKPSATGNGGKGRGKEGRRKEGGREGEREDDL